MQETCNRSSCGDYWFGANVAVELVLPATGTDATADAATIPVAAVKKKKARKVEVISPNLLCYCRQEYKEDDPLGNMIQCCKEGDCTSGEWFNYVHVT